MAKPKSGKYHQGIYTPINPEKCLNKNLIEFRSGLEYKYLFKIDKSPNIIRWGSETLRISYYNPVKKRTCQYWTDLYLEVKDGDETKKLIVEIKPEKEIKAITESKAPKMTKNKKRSTYLYECKMFVINDSKWKAADAYCKQRGWQFITISEKDLEKNNIPFL